MSRFEDRTNKIISKIAAYLDEQGLQFQKETAGPAQAGSMQNLIRALVHTQLSNQTRWIVIAGKLPEVDKLFFDYDKEKILAKPPGYFIQGILSLKCGNRCIVKQMEALHSNIRTLECIQADYGGMDAFIHTFPPEVLAAKLSKPGEDYKLHHIGYALAWEFLRAVGVDAAKPDVHLCRILGSERLGFSGKPVAQEREVNAIFQKMARATGMSVSELDDILWLFCASGYGNICTATPRCDLCCVKIYCKCNRTKRKDGKSNVTAKLGKHDGD